MINSTYYAGPIQYAMLKDEIYQHSFTYRKENPIRVFGSNMRLNLGYTTIYLKNPDDGEQIIAVWNRYAQQSGSGWIYSKA